MSNITGFDNTRKNGGWWFARDAKGRFVSSARDFNTLMSYITSTQEG